MNVAQANHIFEYRYRLEKRIGNGAMGEIYEAYDCLTQKPIALKRVLLTPQQIVHGSSYSSNNPSVALAQEFRLLATLRHPHIISVLDFGFDHERRPFYTMELLQNVKPITEVQTSVEGKLALLIQLARALAYLHRQGIIHRDLKPSNVLVKDNSTVYVLDFGLARRFHHQQDTTTVGTIAYMAPEVIAGGMATHASDLFSFGLIAYELLTGHHPFNTNNVMELVRNVLEAELDFSDFFITPNVVSTDGEDMQSTNQLFQTGRSSRIMRQMIPIIRKLLSKSPERRYLSASEVIQELERITNTSASTSEWIALTESYLHSAPFVGREHEFELIQKMLSQAEIGRGGILLIGGESGVGKTRLLDEVRIHAVVGGTLVLRSGNSVPSDVPFAAWRAPLKQLLLAVEVSNLEAATLKLILPEIDAIIQRPTPMLELQSHETYPQQLAAVIAALFHRLRRAAILMLENLHQDAQSVKVLQALQPFLPQLSLLILGTYRTNEGDDVAAALSQARHIRLPRFERPDVMALCSTVLGEYGYSPKVLDFLMDYTDGNPYLLIETLRALAEEVGGFERLEEASPQDLLPKRVSAIEHLIQRRLERLPRDAYPLLELAAVSGRVIRWDILYQEAEEKTLEHWLFVCTQCGILHTQDGILRFSSEKLREAILERIEPSTRQQLHQRVAEHLEAAYPDQPAWSLLLVEHWQAANRLDRVIHHAQLALPHAVNIGLYAKAKKLAELLLAHLPPTAQQERLHIERVLGDMYLYSFELDKAKPHFQNILDRTEACDVIDHIHALYGMSQIIYLQQEDHAQARQYLDKALSLVSQHQRPELLPMIYYGLGLITRQHDIDAAQAYYQQAVKTAQELDQPPRFLCYALNDLGVIAYTRGDLKRAATYFEAVCTWSEKYGAFVHIEALGNLGDLARQRGEAEAASDYYQKARELAFKIGKLAAYAHQSYNLALLAVQQRDLNAAINYVREGFAFSQQITDKGLGLVVAMAGIKALQGDYHRAIEWVGLVRAEPIDVTDWTADCDQVLAMVKGLRTPEEIKHYLMRGSNLILEDVLTEIAQELAGVF